MYINEFIENPLSLHMSKRTEIKVVIRGKFISENKCRLHRNLKMLFFACHVRPPYQETAGYIYIAMGSVGCVLYVATMTRRNAPNIWERTGTSTDRRANGREKALEKRVRGTGSAGGSTRRAYEGRDDKWRAGTREARISDGRTRSATENEIGSINAARAAVGIASVVDDDGVGVARCEEGEEGEEAGRGKSVCAREGTREKRSVSPQSESTERERDGETTNPRLRHVE